MGILPVKNLDEKTIGITARGTFGSKGNYGNYWINENECIYYLIERKNTKTNQVITRKDKNNDLLLSGKYPIYVFEKLDTNNQVFKGVFTFEEYFKDNHQVRLKRLSGKIKKKPQIIKPTFLPVTNIFSVQSKKKDSIKGGTIETAKAKSKAGATVENKVVESLQKKGFTVSNVANDASYRFDVLINDINLGLEVKNVNNGYFYISENEIRAFREGECRICFYHDDVIWISKKYNDSKKLISIFNEINEIDAYVINNYDGRYMVDGLKIGINLEFRDELQNDFYNITNLTLTDIMELLR